MIQKGKTPRTACKSTASPTISTSESVGNGTKLLSLSLPEALRPLESFTNWVVWKYETDAKGKRRKPPYNPRTGERAGVSDKGTWATYEQASAAFRIGGYDGVGFVLTGTRFCAFDMDGCLSRDSDSNVSIVPNARKLLEACNSYVEISPSGKGLRVGYGHGNYVHTKRSQGDYSLESYRKAARYITITGDELEGFVGAPLVNIDPTIDRLNVGAPERSKQADGAETIADSYDYPRRAFAASDDLEKIAGFKTMKRIREDAPVGERSDVFQSVVNALYRLGFAPDDILALFEKYREGIAHRYTSEGRLEGEVNRSWVKAAEFEKARVNRLKEWLEPIDASPSDDNKTESSQAKTIRAPINSEEALALAFAAQHRRYLRFVVKWARWFIFKEGCWREDRTLRVREAVRVTCRETAVEHNKENEARKIASAQTVNAVESLAKADHRLAASVDQWDADPWLLNTPRGVVDLRTGEMRQARPEDYMTKMTSVTPSDYGCPLWMEFLSTIFNGDQELIAYQQRILGYALTGVTRDHALFFAHGHGGNGKSVLLSTVAGILADYHQTAPIETFVASNSDRHPTELAALRGARLVTAIETEEGRRWAESRIKQLTGGDPIAARFMRQDFFTFVPQFKLMIAGNYKPSLRAVNEAIKRRFHLIPFDVTIPKEQRDAELTEKLKAEWGGILKWMIEGCLEWQRIGLAQPTAAREATEAYFAEEDAVAAWLYDCCELVSDHWEPLSKLFESWKAFSATAERPVPSETDTLLQQAT